MSQTISQGDVVAVKTTGEYVYFTGKQYDSGQWEVRRPVLSRDGISHQYCSFEIGELETIEEHIKREVTQAYTNLAAQKEIQQAKIKALEEQEADGNVAEPNARAKTFFN